MILLFFQAFTLAWAKLVKRKYDNKFQQYSYADFMKLPVITFEFDGGTKWDVRPEAYMEAADKNYVKGTQWQGKRSFTSRIYVDEPHGGRCFIPSTGCMKLGLISSTHLSPSSLIMSPSSRVRC